MLTNLCAKISNCILKQTYINTVCLLTYEHMHYFTLHILYYIYILLYTYILHSIYIT